MDDLSNRAFLHWCLAWNGPTLHCRNSPATGLRTTQYLEPGKLEVENVMYAKTTILAAMLAFAPLAQADESVAQLARDSGLSERNVRMLLGARTPYFEYRCCYSRMLRQFKEAVGEENYLRLADGRNLLRYDASTAVRGAEDEIVLRHRDVGTL